MLLLYKSLSSKLRPPPMGLRTAGRINEEPPSPESPFMCSQSSSLTCHLHPVKLKTQYGHYIACSDSA